jgi:hypothetical protein
MDEPKTFAEKLDASKDGKEFQSVLMDLFSALDKAVQESKEERGRQV